jgi:hypothetical protein
MTECSQWQFEFEAHFSRRVVRCFTDGRDPEPIEHGLSEMLAQRIYGLALIWKQWKRGKARYAKLRQLGVRKDLAAQTAGSPLGPWRLANSPALHLALPTAYFDSLGIPRLPGALP